MVRTLRWGLFLAALAAGLAGGAPLAAFSDYDTVADLWDRYCRVVGTRDEVEVLACYHESFRSQLTGDKTAAGRARLTMHMADMFELLQRDYDYTVVAQKEEAGKVTYTVKFKSRKKQADHVSTVVFVEGESRWFILQPPELPGMLSAGRGTFTMVAGVVIALVAVGFLVKKALG